ncbi:hypothetical protein EV196_104130 [Mariniflexile fucanivorans]|uniref:DUF4142 domain-containing protein n=1 Tax=Mariniflexile fucanivorans TaxID=264023 RepID=A0A4R1RJX9_9FLAO|nr:hypothetical protein [Mariniflexile fucanivorans]TCL66100.1 hypothetical protein EV196_104130 [Mariniflexile fucanivorans]
MIIKNIEKYLTLSLIITMYVSITSCDFDNEENESSPYNNEAVNERVKVNIEEAKTISDIAILNETLLALDVVLQEKEELYDIKNISNQFKQDYLAIKKSLNDLAEKKLILLPTEMNENEIEMLLKMNEASFSEAYLNKIEALLESEITQLEYLSTITNDIDFKVLTIKALVKLNYNLSKIHKTLKTDY